MKIKNVTAIRGDSLAARILKEDNARVVRDGILKNKRDLTVKVGKPVLVDGREAYPLKLIYSNGFLSIPKVRNMLLMESFQVNTLGSGGYRRTAFFSLNGEDKSSVSSTASGESLGSPLVFEVASKGAQSVLLRSVKAKSNSSSDGSRSKGARDNSGFLAVLEEIFDFLRFWD